MRAIRNSEMVKVMDACRLFINAGTKALYVDSTINGKLKPGEQNDNIRARAAMLREAIKVMLGHDKGRRGKATPNQCASCALQVYCVRVGRTECPDDIPCQYRRADNPGWPEKIFCRNCGFKMPDGSLCRLENDEPADPCCYVHATPPDPYGGKVLENGMIEYERNAGGIVLVDPAGALCGLKRGDAFKHLGDDMVVLGAEKCNPNRLWTQANGLRNFYVTADQYTEFVAISRASIHQEIRNPYMSGLVEGGLNA